MTQEQQPLSYEIWQKKFEVVKLNLLRFRLFSLCGRCVKNDVCIFHQQHIQQILVEAEETGKTSLETWNYCNCYLEGKKPNNRIRVVDTSDSL